MPFNDSVCDYNYINIPRAKLPVVVARTHAQLLVPSAIFAQPQLIVIAKQTRCQKMWLELEMASLC